jgi:hypothetical protein
MASSGARGPRALRGPANLAVYARGERAHDGRAPLIFAKSTQPRRRALPGLSATPATLRTGRTAFAAALDRIAAAGRRSGMASPPRIKKAGLQTAIRRVALPARNHTQTPASAYCRPTAACSRLTGVTARCCSWVHEKQVLQSQSDRAEAGPLARQAFECVSRCSVSAAEALGRQKTAATAASAHP